MRYNEDMLDAITLLSFIIGIANYNENLTQSDKDDIMKTIDKQTRDILLQVQELLEEQNKMLREILERVKNGQKNT